MLSDVRQHHLSMLTETHEMAIEEKCKATHDVAKDEEKHNERIKDCNFDKVSIALDSHVSAKNQHSPVRELIQLMLPATRPEHSLSFFSCDFRENFVELSNVFNRTDNNSMSADEAAIITRVIRSPSHKHLLQFPLAKNAFNNHEHRGNPRSLS